jgi:choline dehydrogenase-like flavoprotein
MAAKIYDYVVVGGGTAGLVLANRLTEDENVHVLVLQAGEDLTADPWVTTPALFPTLLGSDADWNTVTEPQVRLQPGSGEQQNVTIDLGPDSSIRQNH